MTEEQETEEVAQFDEQLFDNMLQQLEQDTGITEDELEEFEEQAYQAVEEIKSYENEIEQTLERLNNSDVYQKLGIEMQAEVMTIPYFSYSDE